MLVGLYVPETIGPASESELLAASSKVRSTPFTGLAPPTSDMRNTAWPSGPTKAISRSSGNGWVKPCNVTLTRQTVAVRVEIVIVDGYGDAAALSLMVI